MSIEKKCSKTKMHVNHRALAMNLPITTSANRPTTSHLSWRSTSETWAAPAVGAGALVGAGEAAGEEAAGRRVAEGALKR